MMRRFRPLAFILVFLVLTAEECTEAGVDNDIKNATGYDPNAPSLVNIADAANKGKGADAELSENIKTARAVARADNEERGDRFADKDPGKSAKYYRNALGWMPSRPGEKSSTEKLVDGAKDLFGFGDDASKDPPPPPPTDDGLDPKRIDINAKLGKQLYTLANGASDQPEVDGKKYTRQQLFKQSADAYGEAARIAAPGPTRAQLQTSQGIALIQSGKTKEGCGLLQNIRTSGPLGDPREFARQAMFAMGCPELLN